ncbi:tail-anchored protein insertion receptor WRB isoform X2 [Heterocephalus glaber]|uniref:Guided entry of tail-anchored proteins factor 1 n=1 Tax=Heterocephalus glaber TaxID=10181 RepID=A0AAX6P2S9_HETGA|nr:tail-anchored protein insertion receptor WRB isoform X2 [Heterocephalus glaber]
MGAPEADRWAWLLVLSFVFGCNVLRILLPSFSSFMSRVLQKDAEQESHMRAEIQDMKQELASVNMMDEFARYARLERKINKMTDRLKTHGPPVPLSGHRAVVTFPAAVSSVKSEGPARGRLDSAWPLAGGVEIGKQIQCC